MGSGYYYLTASLPQLKFKEEAPFRGEQFLEECEKWLSPGDMKEIMFSAVVCSDGAFNSPVLEKWREFDRVFRQELAEYREERKKGMDRKPAFLAGKILEQVNPLEMEISFEKARWDFLESLSVGHFFDVEKLVIYYLQLGILTRLGKFNKDKGEAYFHEICEVKYGD